MENEYILIVDDDSDIRNLIGIYLENEGYKYIKCDNAASALEAVETTKIALILLDVMMPQMDGITACMKLREKTNAPIIFISAKSEDMDIVSGLMSGGDDYVVKPFSPKELMMRVAAVLRRSGSDQKNDKNAGFTYQGLSIDYAARVVTVDGERVRLTPREYELLYYMVNNKGIALTREQLISKVWGYDFFGDDRTLDTHIKLLRKSLGEYSKLIVTLRGVGYRFET